MIEHYLDKLLELLHPTLDWKASRQSFAQKAALLAGMNLPPRYEAIPAIKHLNSLRNKISHQVDFKNPGAGPSASDPLSRGRIRG